MSKAESPDAEPIYKLNDASAASLLLGLSLRCYRGGNEATRKPCFGGPEEKAGGSGAVRI
jgi:hypothetical protein